MNTQNRRQDITTIRVVLTILVVIGHAAFYNTITPFGQIRYQELMTESGVHDTISHSIITVVSDWIYTFHMPAFFALSGCLFGSQVKKGKYSLIVELIGNKAKRLIIPFVIVWLFWNFPIKILTGYYDGISVSRMAMQLFFPNRVYLWYLESLFFAFVLAWIIEHSVKSKKIKRLIVVALWAIGLLAQKEFGAFTPIGNPFRYLLWFYVGMNMDSLIVALRRKKMPMLPATAVVWLLHIASYTVFVYRGGGTLLIAKDVAEHLVLPLLGIVGTWLIGEMSRGMQSDQETQGFLDPYSFGIYLYAEPLNYVLLYLVYLIWGIKGFGSEIISLGLIVMRILLTPLIAIIIVRTLKKLNLNYLY